MTFSFPAVVQEALLVGGSGVVPNKRSPQHTHSHTHVQSQIPSPNPEALSCIADMVQGLGSRFHGRVLHMLDAMLLSGLTQALIDTLAVIANCMPSQVDITYILFCKVFCFYLR